MATLEGQAENTRRRRRNAEKRVVRQIETGRGNGQGGRQARRNGCIDRQRDEGDRKRDENRRHIAGESNEREGTFANTACVLADKRRIRFLNTHCRRHHSVDDDGSGAAQRGNITCNKRPRKMREVEGGREGQRGRM